MSKFSEKSAKISKFLKIFFEFFEKNTKIWGQSSVKFWEKSFPKIHKFFAKLFQKFWTWSLRDRASLMHNIDYSAKTRAVVFFVARDCIWKLTHFCKRIFLVPKISRFLTFFEKIFRLRSIIFETKKTTFEFFHELSIEYTFGARGAGQKNFP